MKTTTLLADLALAGMLVAGMTAAGCSHTDSDPTPSDGEQADSQGVKGSGQGKADASVEAVFLDFAFDASLLTSQTYNKEEQIEEQLLYTVGQLNGDNSVSRVDKLDLSDIEVTDEGELEKISYSAEMTVAWGQKENVPETYTLKLPRDISRDGHQEFVDEYGHDCTGHNAHDVTPNSMWYYYRPEMRQCDLAESDLNLVEADAEVSEINTTGKYPEYHKVWEDGVLKVAAVYGKYEEGATSSSDAGISAYNGFVDAMQDELAGRDVTTSPADVPSSPGVDVPEITFEAQLDENHRIEVHTMLVDNVRTAGSDFDETYAELSRTSDLITYNGHSGLGSNIRALARKGDWQEDQYSIVFMNGCDTYAYVDSALADAHAEVNPDDDTGTKYVDMVMNAMPSYFSNMDRATMALITGLMSYDEPQTFERMFERISSSQVVLVSGEQDNEYVPGMDEDDGQNDTDDEPVTDAWEGLSESGSVAGDEAVRYETQTLPEGSYRFALSGTGDADLYVRLGEAPTTDSYDCRPYRSGSDETCDVDLPSATSVHVMVRGWDDESEFELTGTRRE